MAAISFTQRRCDMRHELLTQRALCIGVNAKKGHAESAFCDTCTSSGFYPPTCHPHCRGKWPPSLHVHYLCMSTVSKVQLGCCLWHGLAYQASGMPDKEFTTAGRRVKADSGNSSHGRCKLARSRCLTPYYPVQKHCLQTSQSIGRGARLKLIWSIV